MEDGFHYLSNALIYVYQIQELCSYQQISYPYKYFQTQNTARIIKTYQLKNICKLLDIIHVFERVSSLG